MGIENNKLMINNLASLIVQRRLYKVPHYYAIPMDWLIIKRTQLHNVA